MTKTVMNLLGKPLLSTSLALSLLLTPALALADGTIQLKPLQQDSTVYSSTYNNTAANTNPSTNAYNAASYGNGSSYSANPNGGYGLNSTSYGSSYYTPSDDSMTIRGRVVSIPKGTLLSIHTDQPIMSSAAHVGDPVNATLENDVYVNDAVAIPAGSQVLGQVASVSNAAHLGKHGEIDVRFDSVKLSDGRVVPISAHIVTQDQSGVLKGDTYGKDVAKGVGIAAGSTGVGTLMGTAAGSLLGSVGTGAVFGLGVGALGGMGYALARKGKDVIVPAGSRMSVMIDSPVTVNN